jgi:hypothetical protein
MARFVLNKKFMPDIEDRVVRALNKTSQRSKPTVKALTPVLTGYARRSVHAIVLYPNGQWAGDVVDDNSLPIPPYDPVAMHTAIIGSNTEPRPDNFTGPGGYYLGLEMGIFSKKGSNMLATGYNEMVSNVMQDVKDALK